jgi:hypothetical protein
MAEQEAPSYAGFALNPAPHIAFSAGRPRSLLATPFGVATKAIRIAIKKYCWQCMPNAPSLQALSFWDFRSFWSASSVAAL